MDTVYADLAFFFCVLAFIGYLFFRQWTEYRIAIEQERTKQKEWDNLVKGLPRVKETIPFS